MFCPKGMHKKSADPSQTSPGKTISIKPPTPPPGEEITGDKRMEEHKEKTSEDTSLSISKEELRESSIAVLRAKALEHSAKVLGSVSDRANGHTTQREEAEYDQTAQLEKSN